MKLFQMNVYRLFFHAVSLLLSLAMLGSMGCRKYEDGPTFSFRSREVRVVNDWVANDITRNDIREFIQYETFTMNFTEGGRLTWQLKKVGEPMTEITADWELASVDEEIKLTLDTPDPVSGQQRLLYLGIRRLTNEEMWITYLTDGDYYDIKLN